MAEAYPNILGPRSSMAEGGGVSLGWFSEDNAHPRTPAAITSDKARMYWRDLLRRVDGSGWTKLRRRGRSGLDSSED